MLTHSLGIGYFFWLLFGLFGIHRFYFGRKGTGFLYLLTFGVAGIGYIVDAFRIPTMHHAVKRSYQAGKYSYTTCWVLLLLLGLVGAHRFYLGQWKSGLLYALTLGLGGLGLLYDLFILNDMLSEANEAWILSPPQRASATPSFG
jgi:TM2 domain-containing membrane protein YozV